MILSPLRRRRPALTMAGGQAKEEQMKAPRGQAWLAETQKRQGVSGTQSTGVRSTSHFFYEDTASAGGKEEEIRR